jgi:hypothetical protein
VPAATIERSVVASTVMMAMNAKASNATGIDEPTFNVPGISSSRTIRVIRKMAVVGAKLPIPRESKNSVTPPNSS